MGGSDKSSGYDYHKIRHQEILTLDDAAAVQHNFCSICSSDDSDSYIVSV